MKKLILIISAASFALLSLHSQDLDLTHKKFWNSPRVKETVSGKTKILSVRGEWWPSVKGVDKIRIEPTRNYVFTAEVRARGKGSPMTELGCWLFDENNKPIPYQSVGSFPYTDTVLAEPCKAGDKVLVVQSAAKWRRGGGSVAFNVPAGKYQEPWKDLAFGIRKIEHKATCSVITLGQPLKKAYPAGTRVRQHQNASHFCFWRGRVKNDGKWHRITGRISGISSDRREKGKWWPTAKFAVLRAAFNVACPKDTVTEVRNISFRAERPSYF